MSLNHLVNVLARRRTGALVLSSIAAVLEGVERVLAAPPRTRVQHSAPVSATLSARKNFFTVRRTHSELGFTFWVLQGHGAFASFQLFDTWADAIAALNQRLATPQSVLVEAM